MPAPSSRRNAPKQVRLNDVADAAGVSIATASRALNGSRPVEKNIADRVRQAAERLQYLGNYHHRSIRLGRAEALGFAHQVSHTWQTDVPGGYFAAVIAGVDAAAREANYVLTIFSPDRRQSAMDRAMAAIDMKRIDALVVAGEIDSVFNSASIDRANDTSVVFTHPNRRIDAASVRRNEIRAVELAVEHLLSLGHRRVLWLGRDLGFPGDWPSRQHLFIEAAWRLGIRGDVCIAKPEDPRPDAPTEQVIQAAQNAIHERVRGESEPFTAIVAYNDVLAIGATRGVRAAGLNVPQDISVVGFDNSVAMVASPALTTVDLRSFELGRAAGKLALDRCQGADSDAKSTLYVEPRLVVRDSTAAARAVEP